MNCKMFKVLSEQWEGDIDGQIMTMIKVALKAIAEIDAIVVRDK